MRVPSSMNRSTGMRQVKNWFAEKGWKPFPFQKQCWESYWQGRHFLLHSSTGSGKTLAACLGPLIEFLSLPGDSSRWNRRGKKPASPPLEVLWLTPLRALSADTARALMAPIEELGLPWTVECRTGDTPQSLKARQRRYLPTCLITTPESLSLLLSYPESSHQFRHLRMVVVDEWHELLGTKRGIQAELTLSRIRKLAPSAVHCGLSATLGNLQQSMACLIGATRFQSGNWQVIRGARHRKIKISTVAPKRIERFPWAGHLGLTMAPQVAAAIDKGGSSLVFTSTRNQAENWYRALLHQRPDWAGSLALHHGSLDGKTRKWVEEGMKTGKLQATVCTSSLDLGVDFSPVTQVVQIGSPKGIARLVQRAGRSGHQPNSTSLVQFVPTHAFELLEMAAATRLLTDDRQYEPRPVMNAPLDCLIQHAVTLACAGPYSKEQLSEEINDCLAYQQLSAEQLNWVIDFIHHGGSALKAYPDFHRVNELDGKYQVVDSKIAKTHRLAIGTIVSDLSVQVQFANGQRLGTVEENFIGRLKPGDAFHFAGRSLELVQLREGIAVVRKSKKPARMTPRWLGGRLPMSSNLAAEVRKLLDELSRGQPATKELHSIREMLNLQNVWSRIPAEDEILVESYINRGRYQVFVFTMEGRLVHEGIAPLVAYRLSQREPRTMMLAVNDYGWMLDSDTPILPAPDLLREMLNPENLQIDLENCLNSTELAKRRFREIAQIAGLIHPGFPGQPKRARHLQASSNMFYDALSNYDPDNLLLQQARKELLERELEWERLKSMLDRVARQSILWQTPKAYTPFAFPLVVEKLRERVSSETLDQRIQKLLAPLVRMAEQENL
jgi:ATP-dependent Lhr-like helicase